MLVFKDLPWYYVEMLDWRVENGIVKAYPKKPLSDVAHKAVLSAFKRWGGKFVSHNGVAYFELILDKWRSMSTQVAVDMKRAYEELQKEVT